MANITISLEQLAAYAGLIVVIGAAIIYINKWLQPLFKPFNRLKTSVSEIEKNVKTHNDFLKNDKSKLQEHENLIKEVVSDNRIMLESILVLLKHAETGNGTGEIAKQRNKLEKYLIEH